MRTRSLGPALLVTGAAAVAPGSGHLLLRRTRSGALILGSFVLAAAGLGALALLLPTAELLESLLSPRTLVVVALVLVLGGLAWIAVIIRTWLLARPNGMAAWKRGVGALAVAAMCLVVAAPLGFAAALANSQRNLINALFPSLGGGSADVIAKPRLNILLLGSDAGPDREGTRTDTMMVASLDTRTGRTILFGLPRNIARAQFPPGSAMAAEFPEGFRDPADPASGDYLLNAVYAYGIATPELAPSGPTDDPGLNLLGSSVSHMLGLPLDYFLEVDMAGFAALIDALGGLVVDVGPEPVPIGGITPSGREVAPDGYIEPGIRRLDGEDALAFARSRTGSTDYSRMGRQRCLIQYVLDQKSPADLLTNFQAVATATTSSVRTDIPQEVLPALVSLADRAEEQPLESVSFDPGLPDPSEPDGSFNTGNPNFAYMRQVVRDALAAPPPPPVPTATPPPPPATDSAEDPTGTGAGTDPAETDGPAAAPTSAAPESLAQSC